MKVDRVVQALINASEKGSNIARVIRAESSLLELLVQEKKGDQKNNRFVHDFKTLADVLVQETVRHDLSQKFPQIGDSIYGEESNKFTNVLGDTIAVKLKQDKHETAKLLCSVLDDNEVAADMLASVAHEDVTMEAGPQLEAVQSVDINVEDIGVWIDPIDSTAQYINGVHGSQDSTGLFSQGLQCVAVLIGVYNKVTGLPIIGVTNRPFASFSNGRWSSELMWGVSLNDCNVFSIPNLKLSTQEPQGKVSVLMSKSEDDSIQEMFKKNCSIHYAAGAGYKLLSVTQGLVNSYILSKNSTFKWDSCGPHAILLALGGGLISFKSLNDLKNEESVSQRSLKLQIMYNKADDPSLSGSQQWCNEHGIVAYRSSTILQGIIDAFKNV